MRTQISSATALVLMLAGCAASAPNAPDRYGNFIGNAPATHETQLAADAARQLQALYPPASTRLSFRHAPVDRFGQQLVERLRAQGYALQQPPATQEATASTETVLAATKGTDAAAIPFSYVLDTIASSKLYRVTLMLGSQTLTRAYSPQNETVQGAGAWVRKE